MARDVRGICSEYTAVSVSFPFTLFLCSLIILHGLQSLWEYLLSCDLLPPTFVFPPFQTLFLPPLSLWHFLSFLNYNFTKVPLAWLMTSAVSCCRASWNHLCPAWSWSWYLLIEANPAANTLMPTRSQVIGWLDYGEFQRREKLLKLVKNPFMKNQIS